MMMMMIMEDLDDDDNDDDMRPLQDNSSLISKKEFRDFMFSLENIYNSKHLVQFRNCF